MDDTLKVLNQILENYVHWYQLVATRRNCNSGMIDTLAVVQENIDNHQYAAEILRLFNGQEVDHNMSLDFLQRGFKIAEIYSLGGINFLNSILSDYLAASATARANDLLYDVLYFIPHIVNGVEIKLNLDEIDKGRRDQKWFSKTSAYSCLRQLREAMTACGMAFDPTTIRTLLPYGRPVFSNNDRPQGRGYIEEVAFSGLKYRGVGFEPTVDISLNGDARENHFRLSEIESIQFTNDDGHTPYFYHNDGNGSLECRWNPILHYMYFRGFNGNKSDTDLPEGIDEKTAQNLKNNRLLPPNRLEFRDDSLWGGKKKYCLASDMINHWCSPVLYEAEGLFSKLNPTSLLREIQRGAIQGHYRQYQGSEIIERLARIPYINQPQL